MELRENVLQANKTWYSLFLPLVISLIFKIQKDI